MRILAAVVLLSLLSACNAAWTYAGYGAVGALATNAITDKGVLEHAAEFLGKRCENISLYDQPPRCRR